MFLWTYVPAVADDPDQEFVCFVYHRFGDDRYPSTSIPTDVFRQQLQHLRDTNVTVLSLSDALHRLDAGDLTGPTVVMTIDDGYASFRDAGLPVLLEFGMPATLFVSSASVGGGDMMTWDDLARLKEQGIELGNHTASHRYFLNLPTRARADTFRADVAAAQSQFQTHLGYRPALLSYPYGEFDQSMREVTRDLDFVAAVAQNSGVVSRRADRFGLPRFPMGGPFATLDGFVRKTRMRALPVVSPMQSVTEVGDTAAVELTLRVLSRGLQLSQAQCFVEGRRNCQLQVDDPGDTATLTVRADSLPSTRRVLSTITAPSASGDQWYWFSRVWVRPDRR